MNKLQHLLAEGWIEFQRYFHKGLGCTVVVLKRNGSTQSITL